MTLSAIHRKIPETKKNRFSFSIHRVCSDKPTDQSCSDSISRASLQISLAHVFNFQPTIKIKGSLLKKQANELGDKHRILQMCSVGLLFLLLCY